jgi:hypothetical protein
MSASENIITCLMALRRHGYIEEAKHLEQDLRTLVSKIDAEQQRNDSIEAHAGMLVAASRAVIEASTKERERWEIAVRNMATFLVGPEQPFEIPQIVEMVRRLAHCDDNGDPIGGERLAKHMAFLVDLLVEVRPDISTWNSRHEECDSCGSRNDTHASTCILTRIDEAIKLYRKTS